MFKQLSNLAGNEIFLLISLFIFIAFFTVATIVLIKMKKTHIDYMGDIPLQEGQPQQHA